jgi:hypothetical protein
MPTNKEFNKLASQLSQLAKFYLSHLGGQPAEVAKREKALLSHVKKSHQQLRIKGTALIRAASHIKSFDGDSGCPSGSVKCADGTCVPSSDYCTSEGGLMAEPAAKAKAKTTTKQPAKKAVKKK